MGNEGDGDSEGDLGPVILGLEEGKPLVPPLPVPTELSFNGSGLFRTSLGLCAGSGGPKLELGVLVWGLPWVWDHGRLTEALVPRRGDAAHRGTGPGMIWTAETTAAAYCFAWARTLCWRTR